MVGVWYRGRSIDRPAGRQLHRLAHVDGASLGLSHGLLLMSGLAYAILTIGFLSDDFSVAYIALQSNTALLGITRSPPCGVGTRLVVALDFGAGLMDQPGRRTQRSFAIDFAGSDFVGVGYDYPRISGIYRDHLKSFRADAAERSGQRADLNPLLQDIG